MRIAEKTERDPALIHNLLAIWESSVKATHLFLSAGEIREIKQYVPRALAEVPHLIVAENEEGEPVGFMGVADQMLEMLFVSATERGKGIGKCLLAHGITHYSVKRLAVNEQNPLARGFYEHMGFAVYKRTERDEQGNPYPLWYMERN